MTDNVNKALLIDYNNSRLISCGSLFQVSTLDDTKPSSRGSAPPAPLETSLWWRRLWKALSWQTLRRLPLLHSSVQVHKTIRGFQKRR